MASSFGSAYEILVLIIYAQTLSSNIHTEAASRASGLNLIGVLTQPRFIAMVSSLIARRWVRPWTL